jgi:hypothetical protein
MSQSGLSFTIKWAIIKNLIPTKMRVNSLKFIQESPLLPAHPLYSSTVATLVLRDIEVNI